MVNTLCTEIVDRKNELTSPLQTIYFGGGTPSLLEPVELKQILDTIHDHYTVDPEVEITLEANPDDIEYDKFLSYQQLGVNRLSIGIQSFEPEHLSMMNRSHSADQALTCVDIAKRAGITNITIDLIYGFNELTNEQWEQNINHAIALNTTHISAYAMTIEPDTVFGSRVRKNQMLPPEDGKQSVQFDQLIKQLVGAGFEHYEISNFAKPGHRSKHNTAYWQGKHYIGIGPSAHSFNGEQRMWNIANNAIYLKSVGQSNDHTEAETLSLNDKYNEYVLTRLRVSWGIDLKEVDDQFGPSHLLFLNQECEKFKSKNWVTQENNCLILTPEGKHFADYIAAELFMT